MGARLTPYTCWCIGLTVCASVVTLLVYCLVPVVGNPWVHVVWFAALAGLAQILAVNLDAFQEISVLPSCAILWAVTCVLGPFPAVIVAAASGVLCMAVQWAAFSALRVMDKRHGGDSASMTHTAFGASIHRAVRSVAALWQDRSPGVTILCILACASNLVIVTGPAGLAYQWLGGRFLIDARHELDIVRQFVIPFFGLVAVSTILDLAVYVLFDVAMNPIRGVKGIYRLILRVRLTLIETGLPLVKPQLFLLIVGLLLSYLYGQIGPLGFIVAAMPVVALRDFFYKFVEERAAYVNTITTLATYMQHYHPYTRGHLKRVADLSERLARELRLPAESVRHISTAGFLHDIGKIAVSEEILDKTSKLTDDEWAQIREHPVKGAEIISHIEFLDGIADWIRYHHKWYNGAGYPATNGDEVKIPIEAAIIATVDAFDAMTDDRELSIAWQCDSCGHQPDDKSRPVQCPKCGAEKRRTYREPKPLDEAIEELRRGAGSQFDPRVVKAFLSMVDRDGIRLDG